MQNTKSPIPPRHQLFIVRPALVPLCGGRRRSWRLRSKHLCEASERTLSFSIAHHTDGPIIDRRRDRRPPGRSNRPSPPRLPSPRRMIRPSTLLEALRHRARENARRRLALASPSRRRSAARRHHVRVEQWFPGDGMKDRMIAAACSPRELTQWHGLRVVRVDLHFHQRPFATSVETVTFESGAGVAPCRTRRRDEQNAAASKFPDHLSSFATAPTRPTRPTDPRATRRTRPDHGHVGSHRGRPPDPPAPPTRRPRDRRGPTHGACDRSGPTYRPTCFHDESFIR